MAIVIIIVIIYIVIIYTTIIIIITIVITINQHDVQAAKSVNDMFMSPLLAPKEVILREAKV